MVSKSIDKELARYKTHESSEQRDPSRITELVHAIGVNTTFTLESLLFAKSLGVSYPQADTLFTIFPIDKESINLDYVSGFSEVMTHWAAEVAAASRPDPSTLPIPPLPEDSVLATTYPSLFEELKLQVASGVELGKQSATFVRPHLAADPTGVSYMQERLEERRARNISNPYTLNASELQGMRAALSTVATLHDHLRPKSSREIPSQKP